VIITIPRVAAGLTERSRPGGIRVPAPAGKGLDILMKKWTRKRLTLLTILAVLGVMFFLALRWFAGDRLSPLDLRRFNDARLAWEADPAEDYRITTEVMGRQPARYTVEVRLGRPRVAFRDGKPLKDQRTFQTWTVDGMFATMEHDVDRNAEAEGSLPLHLAAEFDPLWHFPAEYLRVEWGTSMEVAWRVTEFIVHDSADAPLVSE
ncbi:MAG: DUF6174 domain-containing protein, partial [Planctomycetota bacterium]